MLLQSETGRHVLDELKQKLGHAPADYKEPPYTGKYASSALTQVFWITQVSKWRLPIIDAHSRPRARMHMRMHSVHCGATTVTFLLWLCASLPPSSRRSSWGSCSSRCAHFKGVSFT
jgi:hypothetical protein